jgi:hypothetical protein
VTLTTLLHIMPSLRTSEALNPLFLYACMTWTGTNVLYKCFLACGHHMCCRNITIQLPLYTFNNKLF